MLLHDHGIEDAVLAPTRRSSAALLAASCVLMTAGCGDPGSDARAATSASASPSSVPATTNRVEVAPGVTLEAGPDGVLPVSLRWVVRAQDPPEAVAVEDGSVYVAAETLSAFRLTDGTRLWEALPPDGQALGGSGAVVIGVRGADAVRVWAPYEYDLTVTKSGGAVVQFARGVGADVPAGLEPFPVPEPERFTIETGLEQVVARGDDGSVAWQITVDEPVADELPPIGVPGGVVITTSSGHVLLLEHR